MIVMFNGYSGRKLGDLGRRKVSDKGGVRDRKMCKGLKEVLWIDEGERGPRKGKDGRWKE